MSWFCAHALASTNSPGWVLTGTWYYYIQAESKWARPFDRTKPSLIQTEYRSVVPFVLNDRSIGVRHHATKGLDA